MPGFDDRDTLAISTLRFLAVDMVERANSGHPGAPLGLAPLAHLLWTRHLRHDPRDPAWPNRDRFVLSCGHASALLYALLHLAGYELPMSELERFRQIGSRTPGHPEHGHTVGVETTTGPLGQGLSNAVGMAIAGRMLGARFNRDGYPLFDHRVWVLASDGDLMEGVSAEASSLAGHHRLGNLKVFWDSNSITIDGPAALAWSEDVVGRYRAYGWRVLEVDDGNDLEALDRALTDAEREEDLPTFVAVRTAIGFGSPKEGTAAAHGAPLGEAASRATRERLGWPTEGSFLVPEGAREPFARAAEANAVRRAAWAQLVERFREAHPAAASELDRRRRRQLPEGWDAALLAGSGGTKPIATRAASGRAIQALAPLLPELVGGSADLSESNNTLIDGERPFAADAPSGRILHFGVREHAMGSILNGLALSGLLRPFGGTFLIFSDYMRPAIRLAALMGLPVVYVFTHDSIFLGEDGPTHQPISQLASLRSIPGLVTLRPADAHETAAAWRVAMARQDGPTALALSRQKLPVLEATARPVEEGVARGAYVAWESEPGRPPEILLVATGSEVELALRVAGRLADRGRVARVVSMPSWELFSEQTGAYREATLPSAVTPTVVLEAGSPFGWHRWTGPWTEFVTLDGFGASAPAADLAARFGFTEEAALARCEALLAAAPG